MADDTPRRGLLQTPVPTPDDVDPALLPRRSSEVWEFQGNAETDADEPRRSSATDDVAVDKGSDDAVVSPARVVIPPIPAQPAGASTLGKFASSPASAEIIAVARRSATSPSEWEQWADSPTSPPSYAELSQAASDKNLPEPTIRFEAPLATAATANSAGGVSAGRSLPDWVWYVMSALVLAICAALLILAL